MLNIQLFGELRAEHDGTEVVLPASRRASALLAWLALNPGRHLRSRLAARFWPDVLDASARASLRSAVWALRSSLGPDAGSHLVAERDSVSLAGAGLTVDAREFERLAANECLDDAVALCRGGELLDGFDDEWVYEARQEHSARLASVLAQQVRRAEEADDAEKALAAARALLALRPFDEAAACVVMRLLGAAGDVTSALEVYSRVRRRIRAELGADVAPTTAALAERMRKLAPAEERVDVEMSADRPLRLIGREGEWRLLRDCWRAAFDGRGGVAVLSGEGGIGKTRLCEELRAVAERSGALVAAGAANGPGSGSPLALWSEALGELVAGLGADESLPAELARFVMGAGSDPRRGAVETSSGGSGPGARADQRLGATEPHLERVRLFEAVVGLIARAAADRPLVLILEDLHQADPSSLDLAGYVGRRIARWPVLLLLTRRRLPPRPDVEATLAALRSRGALKLELDLRELSSASIRELARSTTDLSDDAVEQIAAAASGSPLIAVQAAMACARGDDPAGGLAEAVRAATARLSVPARLFVELVAVAGRDVDRSEILAFPMPDPERAETEALGADLLRVRTPAASAPAHTIGFRHQLLADAVYRDLPEPARARLHDAFAEALRRRAGGPAGGRRAAEIARHLRLAGRDDLAVGQLVRAAADARAVTALSEAAGFLQEAAAVDAYDPEILVELAEVEAWRGRGEESDAAFARALEVIAPGDGGALVSAWLRRGRWLHGSLCHPRESKRSYRIALDVLDRDPAADPPARAEALAGLAWAEAVTGDPAEVERLLQQVDAVLGRPSSPDDLLAHDIGLARAQALLRAGRYEDSYGPLIAASAAAGRAGRPDMAYTCLINAASAAACAGDLERALDFADRCLPLVEPNGLLRLGVDVQSARAAVLRRLGRFKEARDACEREAELAERLGRADLEGLALYDRGMVAAARREYDAAAADLAQALDLDAPVSRPLARLSLAEVLARAGRLDEAEAELRATTQEPVGPGDFPATLVARMNRVQGLVAARRGDAATARQRLDEAAAGWKRVGGPTESGEHYVAALIDLGRPPMSSLVEPERELAAIAADLTVLES